MNDQRVLEVLARLDGLDRENATLYRRLRLGYAAIAISIVFIAAGAGFQAVGRFQKAVEVYDSNSRIRGVLYADNNDNKSGLEINDALGRAKLSILTNPNDDPFIVFKDARGNVRMEMGIAANGDSYLFIKRGDGSVAHGFVAPL